MLNTTFTPMVATTLKNYTPQLFDNITNNNVFLWALKQMDGVDYKDGGSSWVISLNARKNTTVKSYSGYDILDTSPQNDITAAEFPVKQIAGVFSISGIEDYQNSGKSEVIDLWNGKMENLEISHQLEINKQLYGDGTLNSGKDLDGLGIAVEDGTAWSVYAEIDSNVETWWRNKFIDAGVYNSGTVLLDTMRSLFNSASRGADKVNLIIGAQVLYEQFESTLTVNERYIKDNSFGADLANAGFRNLEYKGAWFVFDDDITPNLVGSSLDNARGLLMLNLKYLKLCVGKDRFMVPGEFQRPVNQDAWVTPVISYLNLVTKNRARQGRAVFTNPA